MSELIEQSTELAIIEAKIESKKQELEALKIQEQAKTERIVLGGILTVIGVALIAGIAASANNKPNRGIF